MRKEIIRRRVKVYLNASGLQMRQALVNDDYKNGINPYHNNSSPSSVYSQTPQQSPLVSTPSVPSGSSDD